MGGDGSMSVRETCNKSIPILFVGCFFNPAFERSKCVDCDLWDIRKQESEVLHDKILFVEKGSSGLPNLVAARCQHLLGWAVVRSSHYLSNDVELLDSYHMTHTRYVIKHLSDVLISFHLCH